MKTAALMIAALALFACAESDPVFDVVADVVEPNDDEICECRTWIDGVVICHNQFCEPCGDSCPAPIIGQRDWSCNSTASDWAAFGNWSMCQYPD